MPLSYYSVKKEIKDKIKINSQKEMKINAIRTYGALQMQY